MARIELDHASVTFPIFDASSRSLKQRLLKNARALPTRTAAVGTSKAGGTLTSASGAVLIEALRDVDLSLGNGDRLALVGHNGAGKSTLLRLMSRIYEPTAGTARVEGRIAPVFDLGIGMDPEISGYENILIRGLFLGMSRRFMQRHIDDIADFTELGDYLKLPLRSYSTGMRVRLALGVVTVIEPEILLLDEGLGAVDHNFIEKATAKLEDLVAKAGILVFASHSESLMVKLCTSAIRMDGGAIVDSGEVRSVIDRYVGRDRASVDG